MDIFKNKVDYFTYKNNPNGSYPSYYSIEGDATFAYPIDGHSSLFEDCDIEDVKDKKGYFNIIKPLEFAHTSFDNQFKIERCIFKYRFGLYNNCEFKESLFLNDCIFCEKFDISDAHFNNDESSVSIYKCHFKDEVDFSRIKSSSEIKLQNCIFDKAVQLSRSIIRNKIQFINCKFKKELTCEESEFNSSVLINNNTIPSASFSSSHFLDKLKIWYSNVGKINFQNCHFDNTVNISHNKTYLKDKLDLDFTYSIIKKLFFIDSDLGEKIVLSKSISFKKALITSDAFVFIRNVNNDKDLKQNGEIDFFYANILGVVTLQDINIKKLDLRKSTITGQVNIEDVQVGEYIGRDTVVRIKNEFIKKSDTVSALAYKSLEYEKYRKKINWKSQNKYLLLLNYLSNNHGQSWFRGVGFTMIVAMISYWLINYTGIDDKIFVLDWKFSNFGDVWKGYLKVLNLLNFDNEIDGVKLNAWGETWFFLSKIFISYGIYQTVSAFRKYGK